MSNKLNVGALRSGIAAVDAWAVQIAEAIRTLATSFGGAVNVPAITWMPFGRNGPAIWSGFYQLRTTNATQARIATYALRDKAVSKVAACITGRSTANNGYGVDLEVTYKRNGTAVAIVGGGTLTRANEREDVAGWDTTISTVTVGSDVFLLVLVTGAASTTLDWACELRVQETPNGP